MHFHCDWTIRAITICLMKSNGTRLQLFLASATIALVWQLQVKIDHKIVPLGYYLLYPLTLLGTFVHEMGHGLTALLLGNSFSQMVMNMDGSGMAHWSGNPGRINVALIAAGGLVGPSVAGSILLMVSRTTRGARLMLMLMAAFMGLCALIWVRNVFGLAFVLGWAAFFYIASKIPSDRVATFVLHVVAITLCMAIFRDIDYMFSDHANVSGVMNPSDSAQMAKALFLPYWVWGAIVAAFSVIVMWIGIGVAAKSSRSSSSEEVQGSPANGSDWKPNWMIKNAK
jgi:Peptidase M50B-like